MITYLLPTRNRPDRLRQTLDSLGELSASMHEECGGAEAIVVDNASDLSIELPKSLRNGLPLRVLSRNANEGAAARNIGVQAARGEWIIMLDDDSFPLNCGHIEMLRNAPDDVAAIGADIFLPNGERESGGLPEVFIGCGVAIRRDAFLAVGGYDPTFDYYAEEYDLCAKLILDGWRIVHDQRFRVRHEKVAAGRDMNRIVHRLVRNNGWVAQRYAPDVQRDAELSETVSRYARIAVKENAARGFARGMDELLQTLQNQPRRPMSPELFDRFTGLSHARAGLEKGVAPLMSGRVCIVDEGKNAWAVKLALHQLKKERVIVVTDERDADLKVIGTLSPGPMLDAWRRRMNDPATAGCPVLTAWSMQGSSSPQLDCVA